MEPDGVLTVSVWCQMHEVLSWYGAKGEYDDDKTVVFKWVMHIQALGLKLKPRVLIWHILQGNMTSRALQSSEVAVDRQDPMVLQR